MNDRPGWHLSLLGHPRLLGPQARALPLARTTLFALAILALDGRTSRARLSALLWPDTPEAAARNNLVHLTRRLRAQTNADLILAGVDVTLAEFVTVDVRALSSDSSGPPGAALAPLLEGADADDDPELSEWLSAWRAQVERWQVAALRREVTRLTQAGLLQEAIAVAGQWRAADALSEEPWRTLMRLHHLNGDRASALQVYRACEGWIRQEFASAPSPETRALAAEISRQEAPLPDARPKAFPIAVQRPPQLIGQDDVWARMELAWARGQLIFVSGDPGSGKTRLLQDFARSKGTYLWLEGRPGDTSVPYGTLARILRAYLHSSPEQELPEYMRHEVSRLLPELLGPDGPPPPITDDEAKGRFYTAVGDAITLTTQGASVIVMDDWQFNDDASQDFGVHFAARTYPLPPGQLGPPGLVAFQTGTLPPAAVLTLESILRGGLGIHIELQLLAEGEVRQLLASLDLPELTAWAPHLARLTGGNPQFVLETVRHLIEADLLGESPDTVTLPPRLQALLHQRLAPLSATALQVAQAASVVQRDFTVELLSDLLSLPLMDVADAWHELEVRQVFRDGQFGHQLMRQAVAGALPEQTRRLLHRRAARTLELHHFDASRIAQHWAEGQDARQAARWYRQAAAVARDAYRPDEAETFLASAATLEAQAAGPSDHG